MTNNLKKKTENHNGGEQEFSKRKECIQLKQSGWKASHIAQHLGRSRKWVHKWIKRYDPQNPNWFLSHSTRPGSSPQKTNTEIEEAVVMIRQELVQQKKPELEYSFIGAIAIHQQLYAKGIQPLPSLPTISRIIRARGLTIKKHKTKKSKTKIYYPTLVPLYPNHRHELDLVTPRYISGYGKVVAVNRIDIFTNQAQIQIYQSKGADNILEFLTEDWKQFGIPIYLQLDNEASFRGGMYHPRSFGKLIRFCLNFGVQIIFIPWKEPWRNPYIENFNGHFNRLLWTKKRFTDMDHLRHEAQRFLKKHNPYQTYKKDHFSKGQFKSHTKKFLPQSFKHDPDYPFPITKGELHFIRLVEEDGSIEILNEKISVNKELVCEYVWATVDTAKQTLSMYHQADKKSKRLLVKEQKYELREPVKDRIPVNKL